jgi:hypothetical protein
VRGVASSRISARKGFYTALVGLLSTFSFLNVELVLAAVKKELHSANSSKSVSLCCSLNDINICIYRCIVYKLITPVIKKFVTCYRILTFIIVFSLF